MIKISVGPYYYVSNSNHIESFTLRCPTSIPSPLSERAPLAAFFSKALFMYREKKISLLSLPSHAHSKLNPLDTKENEIYNPGQHALMRGPLNLCFYLQNSTKQTKEAAFLNNQRCPAYYFSNNV